MYIFNDQSQVLCTIIIPIKPISKIQRNHSEKSNNFYIMQTYNPTFDE